MSTDSSDAGDKHIAFGDLDDMIAALSSATQEEIDKSKVQHKVLYFFLKHLSGPESQILESDWLIARS